MDIFLAVCLFIFAAFLLFYFVLILLAEEGGYLVFSAAILIAAGILVWSGIRLIESRTYRTKLRQEPEMRIEEVVKDGKVIYSDTTYIYK